MRRYVDDLFGDTVTGDTLVIFGDTLVTLCAVQSKEVTVMREGHQHHVELRAEVERLRGVEMQSRQWADRLQELEEMLAKMKVQLAKEKEAKDIAIIEKDNIVKERDSVC